MRCEVVAVGTELLLGQVVDTNSAWIGEHLALAGIDSLFQVKVGDNHARIVAALRQALARSDAVICCGGLGPTQDDITREAIAEVMGVGLTMDDLVAERIRVFFAGRQRPMSANNLHQAMVPDGATVMAQMPGTAPGLVCPVGEHQVVYAVPGVPYEMREMVEGTVIPDLVARSGSRAVIVSRTLRTWGLAESAIAEVIAPRLEALDLVGNPTIAFLASGIEGIKVRVTARVEDPALSPAELAADAGRLLDSEEAQLRALLGDIVFGLDDDNMEAAVSYLLAGVGRTLAVAESLTGGLIGSRLTAVAGASDWFRGGVISYASQAKRDLLGVADGPVVSEAAARQMALGVARALDADTGLAVTGVAGPTEQEGQPVGTVWVGIAVDGEASAQLIFVPGDRERVRQRTVISALDLLRRRLLARS